MTDAEIEAMAAQLEAAAGVEDAKFRLDEFFDYDDDTSSLLIANRAGFLHLAAQLLRGAVAEENVLSPPLIEPENEDAETFFDKIERRETWVASEPIPPDPQWRIWLDALVFYAFMAVVLGIFGVGVYAIFDWI